jgi:Flp pilus assembly pilin Flp
MRFMRSARGAEMSEVVAGLLVILVAGVAAISTMFTGLDGAATKISTWIGNLAIPAP